MTDPTLNRNHAIGIRLRPHERESLERAARLARQRLSEYSRDAALAAARRDLERISGTAAGEARDAGV
jgi:uncharacterized protein (DUF1778 family)